MIMTTYRTSFLGRSLLAASLAIGFGTVWFVLAIWIGTSILVALPGKERRHRDSLVVANDGTLMIESYSFDNLTQITYRDLNGRERDAVPGKDQARAVYIGGEHDDVNSLLSDAGWARRIKLFVDEREPNAIWYFVHDGGLRGSGSGYFVGYERVSNRLIGSIGLSGFHAGVISPGDAIPVRGELALEYTSWSSAPLTIYSNQYGMMSMVRPDSTDVPPRLVHVPSGNRLRLVDLAARTVTTVFEAPGPIVSVGVPTLSSYSGGSAPRERPILVRAGRTIFRLDHHYHLLGTWDLPAEIDSRSAVSWYEIDGGQSIVECTRPSKNDETFAETPTTDSTVYRVAADGTIRDTSRLALVTGSSARARRLAIPLMALGLPGPAVLLAGEALVASQTRTARSASMFGSMLRQSWPSLAALLALSTVLAGAAWRRGRVFGLSRSEQSAWSLCVLLLGVPAYVGFLLSRRWPARRPCPHCQVRGPRDRDRCAACGTPFPDPALKGTEIFA